MDKYPNLSFKLTESQSSRSRIIFALRFVFGLGLVGFLIWRTDFSRLISTLVGVDPFWLGMAFLVQIIGKFIWTARWFVLLEIFKIRVSFRRLLIGLMIGLFFNNFLPTSMGGDFYRGYWILDDKTLYRKSLFIIFIERLIGFVTLGYIAIPAIPFILLYGTNLGTIRYWLILCMLMLCMGVLLLNPRINNFLNNLFLGVGIHFLKNARSKISHSLVVLHEANSKKLWVYFLSFVSQWVGIAFVYCIGRGLGLPLHIWHYFVIVPIQVLVTLLPISINGLGVREWILILLTSALSSSVTSSQAISLGLLITLVGLVISLIGGGFYVAGKRHEAITA
jgi:glycosyltransferase 2 family protein